MKMLLLFQVIAIISIFLIQIRIFSLRKELEKLKHTKETSENEKIELHESRSKINWLEMQKNK